MTTLEERVSRALGNDLDSDLSPWSKLIALFKSDREAFYILACDDANRESDPMTLKQLAGLARFLRSIVRETYQIMPRENDRPAKLISRSEELPIPEGMEEWVGEFLREIDGKGTRNSFGKDYEGNLASEAEFRFKLGEPETWEADRERLQRRRSIRPLALRVDPQDIQSLSSQPSYVIHGLLNCARRTVLAPSAIFEGLNRGHECPPHLTAGWAFCGKPRKAFTNEGNPIPVPENMVYMVYTDREGFVFDWDWVKENPREPGFPLSYDQRFGKLVTGEIEAVLEIPPLQTPSSFNPSKACYSERGDCIFCYLTDELAYADRINPDLTVFRQFESDKVAGFKIKNVGRILQNDKSVILDDAPDLTVSVDGILLATLKLNKDASVEIYTVVIEAYWRSGNEPPRKVKVPRGDRRSPQLVQV